MEYIVVILGAERTENGLSGRYLDCKKLFNYAFDNYKTYTINEKNSILKQIEISNATFNTKNLNVVVKDDITLLMKNTTNVSSITPNIEISSDLKAPISKNSVVGTISYTVDGNEYCSDLLAETDVIESNFINTFLTISSVLLVLFLLSKLLKSNKKTKKKSRSKKSKSTKRNRNSGDRNNYLYW